MASSRPFSSASSLLLARGGGINAPPEVKATWPAPNYVNPEERGWAAPIALIVLLILTLLIYICRIWGRFMVKNLGIDDVLMSVAMLPLIGLTVSTILGIRVYGFQWHMWDQTPFTKITYTNITMAIELSYMVGSTLVKVSILLLYRRLAGSVTTKFIYGVWACMAFCIASFVAFLLAIFFTCSPTDRDNNCNDEGAILVSATAVSTIQDIIICFLPIFLIQNLHMPRRQKLALGGIFGLGLITSVCGVMRVYYLVMVYYYTYDVTWYAYYGWIWTVIESDLGVICASVPALRIYFRRHLDSTVGRTSNSRSKNQIGVTTPSNRGHDPCSPSSIKIGGVEANSDHMVLQSIVVQRDLSSIRDDASQHSDSSTRNLTTIVHGPLKQ